MGVHLSEILQGLLSRVGNKVDVLGVDYPLGLHERIISSFAVNFLTV